MSRFQPSVPLIAARQLRLQSACFLLMLTFVAGCTAPAVHIVERIQYQLGDNPAWAHTDWDDSGWPTQEVLSLPDTAAVMWLRAVVDVPAHQTLGFKATGLAAREVYWDGVFIGHAGRVGINAQLEEAGPIDAFLRIPDTLATAGPHQIAIRISSFKRPKNTAGLRMQFVLGDYAALTTAPFKAVGVPLLFLGGFVLVALYYGALFLADRKRVPYLMTAALCFAVALLLSAESWRNALGYQYPLHGLRLGLVELFTGLTGILLAGTFAVQFGVPRRRSVMIILTIAVAVVLGLITDHETATYTAFALALAVALGMTGWASWQKQPGARLAFGGVLVCLTVLIVSGDAFMDMAFFPAFGVLIAGLLTSVGLQTRADRQRHAVARATAARLEGELLKKHLQPHFLMNTLTSIIELVETNPAQAVTAIEAFAAELRTLGEISGAHAISMQQELALCRAHLDVMGYRRRVQFTLDARGVSGLHPIPPAVIHTLIENAITHNAYTEGNVTFKLSETVDNNVRTLELRTPLANPDPIQRQEGGGLRYVRARLEEAAPGACRINSGIEADAWVTRIQLPADLPQPLT